MKDSNRKNLQLSNVRLKTGIQSIYSLSPRGEGWGEGEIANTVSSGNFPPTLTLPLQWGGDFYKKPTPPS